MNSDFLFQIGDFVTVKASAEELTLIKAQLTEAEIKLHKSQGRFPMPIRLIVLERRLQECPGGSQKHYLCRYWTREGFKTEFFNEIELAAYPEER